MALVDWPVELDAPLISASVAAELDTEDCRPPDNAGRDDAGEPGSDDSHRSARGTSWLARMRSPSQMLQTTPRRNSAALTTLTPPGPEPSSSGSARTAPPPRLITSDRSASPRIGADCGLSQRLKIARAWLTRQGRSDPWRATPSPNLKTKVSSPAPPLDENEVVE
jgi:hypothetical protein